MVSQKLYHEQLTRDVDQLLKGFESKGYSDEELQGKLLKVRSEMVLNDGKNLNTRWTELGNDDEKMYLLLSVPGVVERLVQAATKDEGRSFDNSLSGIYHAILQHQGRLPGSINRDYFKSDPDFKRFKEDTKKIFISAQHSLSKHTPIQRDRTYAFSRFFQ